MNDIKIGRNLSHLRIKNHPILNNFDLDLINPKTNKPYDVIAFVGENGCGKTTLLNEIFNYDKSEFIYDKENVTRAHQVLYLRQGSVHSNALKEVRALIDGKNIYPTSSCEKKFLDARMWSDEKAIKVINKLGDQQVSNLVADKHLDDISCSGDVSKIINGKEYGYNITNFSSGQQEILLKFKDIQDLSYDDILLLDEPETSLHPRWQKQIINIIRSLIEEEFEEVPQIFLATHSEKVLESLINNKNALIIRLFKDNGVIKTESINEIDLCLPSPTFAELDYVVFHISSLSYHDELFNYFQFLVEKNSTIAVDEKIRLYGNKLFKSEMNKYEKTRIYTVHGKPYTTNTLPTYIRDFFHHPNEIQAPTNDELELSIMCLRELVKYLINRGFDNKD